VFQRTGKKYRDRTYRYVVADAGHAVLNAHAASRALGVEAHWARLFDEQRVARALGIDEDREGLLALATLARQPPRVEAPGELFDVPPAFDPAPLGDPSALPLGVTTLAHRATSLRAVVTDRPGGAVGAPVALSPPTASGTTVLDAIRRRRSVRRFSSEPIGSEDFSGVLWESIGARPLFSRAVEAYVIVERVDGVSPGVYRYEAGTHSLVPVSLGSASARAGAAALDQEVVQSAAASIVLASPVAALRAATEGARGYRHALLEAGVRGGALYLAAGARGLGACSLGAFYDEEARALVGGGDLWALHLVALGVPAAG
jgi:SagB-type dehydrogenase family enzyme